MPIRAISFLNTLGISKVGYQPQQHVATAGIKDDFAGKVNLNAPEHRDSCNVGLLGDEVYGKSLYFCA